MKKINSLGLFLKAFRNWQDDNCLRLSAALAYYSIFSIAPLLVIAISMAGLFLGPKAAQDQIHQQMQSYVGSKAAESVQSMVQSASQPQQSMIGTVIGVVTLLAGAAGVFGQLKDSLNTIWKVKQKPGGGVGSFVREYFLSFGMVIVIGFLLLVSLVLTAMVSGASAYFGNILKLPPAFWAALTFVASFSVVTVLFATIFRVLPNAKIKWKNVWIGAAATAALFEIGKFGLGWYLGRPSTVSTYGAAGSVVLLLLWVYYASLILFFGAEFTRVYSENAGDAIEPAENAVRIAGAVGELFAVGPAPHKEHPQLIVEPAATAAISLGTDGGAPSTPAAGGALQALAAALSVGAGVGLLLRWRETQALREVESPADSLRHDFGRLFHEVQDGITDRLGRR